MPTFNQIFKRSTAVLVSMLLATASLILMVPPTIAEAAAELPNSTPVMIDNPATGVTADALPTTQINGVAWDQVVVGNTVYVGGNFSTARPAGSPAGSNEVSRTHLMSYNLSTGVMTSWAPLLNGQVRVLAVSPDKTKLYVGGSFTKVNNVTRNRVAAFNISDGSLVSDFAPNVGYTVHGLAVSDSAVYIGGAFQAINSVSRSYLGAVDLSGNLTAWAPTADFTVSSVALSPAQDRLVVSGGFSKINGTSAPSIASVDATSGALYSFAANTVVNNSAVNPPNIAGINPGAAITSLKMANGSVYATAYSWYMGNFEGILKADPYTGTIQNLVECRGDTLDAVPMNGIIYSVGHHHRCEQVGGFPEQTPRYHQFADAVTDDATGRLQAYFPGQPAGSYVHWLPALNTGTASGANQSGWTAETAGDYLLLGGEFTQVSGSAQQGLVRFGTRNVVSKPSAPLGGFGSDMGLSLKNVSTTSTRLSFKALFDRDGSTLNYQIFRTDKGTTTPLTTLTAKSTFWNRPQLTWIDTSVVAGRSYTYYVVAIDPDGNYRTAPRVTIVAGTDAPVASDYSNQVVADGATNYWRMNDPAGSTSITDWGVGSDLALPGSGVTLAREGAIIGSTDTAALFSGSAGVSGGTTNSMAGPNTFSQELWFKTTTTSGGKLLGFGSASSGNSGSYDRHIYMSADGKLNFGVYPGTSKVVSSTKSFNDGNWHYVVSSLSSDGMVLWVDGMKVGEDASVTYGQDYTGYWRVGGDSSWSGANYFNGTIDDVAIYNTPLTRAQIRDHYAKSGRTLNLPPLPTDSYGKAVTDDDPTLYWRLDETGGTSTAVDANGGGIDGTYYNGVVQGVPSDVVAGNGAAQFDGSDDLVSSNTNFNNPTVYSIEAWFKTTSTRGGKIVGFGRAQTGSSGSYDRHVYMSADGRLNFGAYNGNTNVATSAASYNDGTWHYVVATMGANGQMLYVDGALVGTHPNTQSESYVGFWRVGGDNSWSGDPYFSGSIDEVAIYSKALSADRVLAHYRSSSVNKRPVPEFEATATSWKLHLDASASSDDGSIAGYAWDFGDGASGSGQVVDHTYAADGTYSVKLTVTDNQGLTATLTKSVTVHNAVPTASFTATPKEWTADFDASSSTDDGTVASYAWEFGDGTVGTGREPSHTYAADGTYQVKLTVTDDLGATNSVTKPVTVANAAPVAAFSAETDGLKLKVDASAATDDLAITSYAWDFGDGVGTGKTASHTYAAAGTYTVTLTVTDGRGLTGTKSESVTLTVNAAPTAAFTATSVDLKVTVDGTGSNDPDGSIEGYAWDFGDGGSSTQASTTHTYAAAGTYSVKLTVTDNEGKADSITKSVTVTAPAVTVLASDSFERSTTNGWGSADKGGTWTVTDSSQYSVNGTSGVVVIPKAGTGPTARLASVSARDVTVKSDFKLDRAPTGSTYYHSLYARMGGSRNYSLQARVSPSGALALDLVRTVSGTSTTLKSVTVAGVKYTAGDQINLRFDVTGTGTTTLAAKAWRDGDTEPEEAQVTTTDTTAELQNAGATGMKMYAGGALTSIPLQITVDSFKVESA